MTMWCVILNMFDDGMQIISRWSWPRTSDTTFSVTHVINYPCV